MESEEGGHFGGARCDCVGGCGGVGEFRLLSLGFGRCGYWSFMRREYVCDGEIEQTKL